MKIKRISLSKVLKLELPGLINDVTRIVENFNKDDDYLKRGINSLREQQELTELLEVPRNAHPLTKRIELLREKELQCVGAIVSHMEFIVRANIDSMRPAATIAAPVVRRYLSGLRKNNESVINQIIKQFLQYSDDYPEVCDGLSNLGLQPFMDELKKINAKKLKFMSLRDTNPRQKVNSRLIQKEIQNQLSIVFDLIDVLNSYDDKPNYDNLIQELNILLTRYATIINTRKTNNKKKAAKKMKRKAVFIAKKINQDEATHILLPNLIEALRLRNLDKT